MKNNKGFFLAETIIVLTLVTTAIAFVLPNVTKVYENYKNTSKYYDQVKDIYTLKAISERDDFYSKIASISFVGGDKYINNWCETSINAGRITDEFERDSIVIGHCGKNCTLKKLFEFEELIFGSYIGTDFTNLIPVGVKNKEEYKKYVTRMKKTSYDTTSYRLIGVFQEKDEYGNVIEERYASIKIPSPGCTP